MKKTIEWLRTIFLVIFFFIPIVLLVSIFGGLPALEKFIKGMAKTI